ncbi:hypothetical protein fugu_003314 [Takifugu bimaculatus]|uniref:Uncharacterized protein n=1 Tax=Takifugu bimaculatus TaxID=433685 RepID=A0A4Z2BFJ6_9TELE|nr:hypothetical protein fugu_003314 [Takifugu bimaculatus]
MVAQRHGAETGEEQEKLARSSCPPTPRVLDSPDHMTHTRIHLKGRFRELNLKGPIRTSSFGAKLLLLLEAPTLVLRPRGRRALQSGSEMSSNDNSFQNEATSVPSDHRRVPLWSSAGAPMMLQVHQVQKQTPSGLLGTICCIYTEKYNLIYKV